MDDYNEIAKRISYLGFCASIKQGKKVEVEIVGEGAVKDVVIKDNKLVIIGEDQRQSLYVKGYSQAVADIDRQLSEGLVKKIEAFILTPEPPKYDFRRDYHGQFKKKEG